ncbi:twin-arginine translocation pathway signal [Pandoraea communis]|uniref:Twin-arginine translocation pathway signal n=1 Tax=Pandoraea communis TaxID=2508297 RepID=A0A5E4XRF0_9BURK|nr:twin-arginine translocation pathway signal [Pandoraea communis]VVE38906.1 twin-arginine translocation pathway signal [Pandoraea communis]
MKLNADFPRSARKLVSGLLVACACFGAVSAQAQAVLIGKDDWLFYAQDNMTDAGRAGIDNSVNLMRSARDALKAKGIGLVVIVAPLKARFYEDKLPAGTAMAPAVRDRYAQMIDSLRRADIQTVDLMPVLKGVAHDNQTAFFQKDSHWTAWSAEAAAAATADVIKKNWSLTGQPGTGKKLGNWIKERRFADFADLMTAAQRKAVGQEIYVVRSNKAEEGGLLDDVASPVHVVGNSFVQPYLGFPQALSADIDRPVGLTWKYGNFGPWAVFAQYLESPAFQQARPQVVVWQLNEVQMLYGPNTSGQWDAASLMTDAAWRERVAAAIAK